jgi:hypothetical protein
LHGGDGAHAESLSNGLAFLQMDLIDPDFHTHAHAHSRAMQAEVKSLLDEAVAAGDLRRCDTKRLARAVHAIIVGSLLQWAIDRDTTAVGRLRQNLDTLLRLGWADPLGTARPPGLDRTSPDSAGADIRRADRCDSRSRSA